MPTLADLMNYNPLTLAADLISTKPVKYCEGRMNFALPQWFPEESAAIVSILQGWNMVEHGLVFTLAKMLRGNGDHIRAMLDPMNSTKARLDMIDAL